MSKIKSLSISGFKSIRRLDNLELHDLNVLIGANGAGKSNFVSFLQMLKELYFGRLQLCIAKAGGSDRILTFGQAITQQLSASIKIQDTEYNFVLEPTAADSLVFASETIQGANKGLVTGAGHKETVAFSQLNSVDFDACRVALTGFLSGFRVFHFHDTSNAAGIKRMAAVHDDEALRQDGSNLAAFLLMLKSKHRDEYEQIRKAIQLVIPFFDDFQLQPRALNSGEQLVNLVWKQRDSDYPFWPSQLSDGSIRFICLATVLLQPDPPSTIIIDEPELGLHPYAITLLGSLLKSASKRMQVIISTQSVPLVNQFSIDDLIIVEREDGASVFKRRNEIDYQQWLEDYSVGELWEKNILGGRPPK